MMRALVLGAAALALSASAILGQAVSPTATAPLYDYAGPASPASHGYSPLVYAAPVYAPTLAYPAPPTAPGYYAAPSVVASVPLYDYVPGFWGR
jgi:hypothetical protein